MIGAHIKRLREQRNISMSELARRANVSKSLVSRIEAGMHEEGLKIESLRAIATALCVPDGELLTFAASTLPTTIIEASQAAEQAVNAQEYVARLVGLHETVKASIKNKVTS